MHDGEPLVKTASFLADSCKPRNAIYSIAIFPLLQAILHRQLLTEQLVLCNTASLSHQIGLRQQQTLFSTQALNNSIPSAGLELLQSV